MRLNLKPVASFDEFVEVLQEFKAQGATTASVSFVRNEVNEIAVNKVCIIFSLSFYLPRRHGAEHYLNCGVDVAHLNLIDVQELIL